MKSKISGTTMPVLEISLEGSDRIVAEPGEFSWMTASVQMRTTAFTAGAQGVWSALRRAVSGGGLFMTEYSVQGSPGMIAFAAKCPARYCRSTSPRAKPISCIATVSCARPRASS